MASRSSRFHQSLHHSRLIMGIEKTTFGALVFASCFCFVAKSFWGVPLIVVLYLLARWLSKRDGQFMTVFFRYLNEEHVYDATPRIRDYASRPKGWGKNLPL